MAPAVWIDCAPHALLDPGAVVLRLPAPLAELATPPTLTALLAPSAAAPLRADDAIRAAVRDLLRAAGFRPTGRSKPSSEYLLRAAEEGRLAPINLAVDLGNAVSLHTGLPISVVDLDRTREPLRIAVAEPGARYVFNAAGQEIDVARLLCLCDADGPCANAVKDAQRTKTVGGTTRALVVFWGTRALPGHAGRAVGWLRDLAAATGVQVDDVRCAAVS